MVLSEETDWLGGQLTSQAVPLDEHPWIEDFGCTARYRALREAIRAHYRAHAPLTAAARARPDLNPGAATVSRLSCEPRAALAVIDALVEHPRIEVLREHVPVAADVDRDRIGAVTLRGPGGERVVEADWFVDATETGELLPLAGAEHVTGAESREETGEPHAAALADPLDMQPVSACFAVDHLEGEDHTIPRPPGYDAARYSLLAPDPRTNELVPRTLTPNPPGDPALIGPDLADPSLDKELWLFRRIAARGNFEPGHLASDITLVNWPQIDYAGGPVFGVPDAARHRRGRARAEPRLPPLAADRGGVPGPAAARRRRRLHPGRARQGALHPRVAADPRRDDGARAGARPRLPGQRRDRPVPDRPAPLDRRAARTSTSPARRSRSRSAR